MLKFEVSRAKHRIEVLVGKFVDLDLLVDTEDALRKAAAVVLADRNDFDMLVCLDSIGPAAHDASAKMEEVFNQFLADHVRKFAHVGLSPLAILQIRRVTKNDPRFQFFGDRAAAEAWLDE